MFDFEHVVVEGLHWHALTAGDGDVPDPQWPGLWEREYGSDRVDNPFLRFGVNNGDGEVFAVWRALAWSLTSGAARIGLPRYDRDQAANHLQVEPSRLRFVRWEFGVDPEIGTFEEARQGFVEARSCVPIRPEPTAWEREHRDLAAIFELGSFEDLTELDLAVSFDVASEMSVFAIRSGSIGDLQRRLSVPDRPLLRDVLDRGDRLVHFTIVRDRFVGQRSYLVLAAHEDLSDELQAATSDFSKRWESYCASAPTLGSFQAFNAAMERLLGLPLDER
jgi:hypothetical protein